MTDCAAGGLQGGRAALEAQLAQKLEAIKQEGARAAAELEKQHQTQLNMLARKQTDTATLSSDLQELDVLLESTKADVEALFERANQLKVELSETQVKARRMNRGLQEMRKEREEMSDQLDVLRGVAVELSSDDEDESQPPPTVSAKRALRQTASHVQGQVAKRACGLIGSS